MRNKWETNGINGRQFEDRLARSGSEQPGDKDTTGRQGEARGGNLERSEREVGQLGAIWETGGRQVTTSGRQVESKETSGKHGCNAAARFPEPSWNLGSRVHGGGKSGSPSLLEMKPNIFLVFYVFWFAGFQCISVPSISAQENIEEIRHSLVKKI